MCVSNSFVCFLSSYTLPFPRRRCRADGKLSDQTFAERGPRQARGKPHRRPTLRTTGLRPKILRRVAGVQWRSFVYPDEVTDTRDWNLTGPFTGGF